LDTRGHHLLFFAPIAGLLVTAAAWMRRPKEEVAEREDLAAAVRWQAAGASIVVVHGVLQMAVEAIRWFWSSGPPLGDLLERLMPLALSGITWLNVGGGAVEWLFLAAWAVAAYRGKPYPLALLRRLRARMDDETQAD
jgi:hypothetical protein